MWLNALITDSGNALEVESTAGDFAEETDLSSVMGRTIHTHGVTNQGPEAKEGEQGRAAGQGIGPDPEGAETQEMTKMKKKVVTGPLHHARPAPL